MPAHHHVFARSIRVLPRLIAAFLLCFIPLTRATASTPQTSASPAVGEITPDQAVAAALAAAGGEQGANDMRLSDMGADKQFGVQSSAVAFNGVHNEYLVVWRGDDNTAPLVNNEFEIFGRRVNAATGEVIGADFRLSEMGPNGDTAFDARTPDVAYSSFTNEYLVVWSGDDASGSQVDDEYEIYGQRVNADTGEEVGGDFRLSDMGADGTNIPGAFTPRVAYNSVDKQFLVVWSGDDVTGGLADEEYEIYAQRVDPATGQEIGADLRISDMGPDGDAGFDANNPVVVFNPANARYLVVWWGDDDSGTMVNGEFEIFGQLLDANINQIPPLAARLSDMGTDALTAPGAFAPAAAYNSLNNQFIVAWYGLEDDGEAEIFGQRLAGLTLAELGANDMRLTDVGATGVLTYGAVLPTVAYNSVNNEYLVAWHGDDDTGTLVDEEYEIFGQRLNAATGAQVGVNDMRLSDMGPDSDTSFGAFGPALAHSPASNQYLVAWQGDDDTADLVNNEFEVFGQRVAGATGAEAGADFRISDMGLDLQFNAGEPDVAYNSVDHEYLVVWHGDDNTGSLVDEEFEIYGQRVDAVTGQELGKDFRLSDMGPDGNFDFDAYSAAVVHNPTNNEYLVVWRGRDDLVSVLNSEVEIFGQRVAGGTGAELGGDIRLSDAGPNGSNSYFAQDPDVAYNSANNEYLVVWSGTDDTGTLGPIETEIFGQRVNSATGVEVGDNDVRLSDMGPDGDINYFAANPRVDYNPALNEYLVVWAGSDDTGALHFDEIEIYAQRVSGVTGLETGVNDQRVSIMGPDGNTTLNAFTPALAFNSDEDEYLVVWQGDDIGPGLLDGKIEVFGQRLAATGSALGGRLRLTTTQPLTDTTGSAYVPEVVYVPASHSYVLTWSSDDAAAGLVDGESEVLARRLDGGTGMPIGHWLRLSDAGPNGNTMYEAAYQAMAYNSDEDEFLAVWYGNDDVGPLDYHSEEIFGQRFSFPNLLYLPLLLR